MEGNRRIRRQVPNPLLTETILLHLMTSNFTILSLPLLFPLPSHSADFISYLSPSFTGLMAPSFSLLFTGTYWFCLGEKLHFFGLKTGRLGVKSTTSWADHSLQRNRPAPFPICRPCGRKK